MKKLILIFLIFHSCGFTNDETSVPDNLIS